eukprot:scaffold137101_cov18-Tisochrysis_lutea.AAC.1
MAEAHKIQQGLAHSSAGDRSINASSSSSGLGFATPMLCGAVARTVAVFAVAPLELARTRQQHALEDCLGSILEVWKQSVPLMLFCGWVCPQRLTCESVKNVCAALLAWSKACTGCCCGVCVCARAFVSIMLAYAMRDVL